jgi:transposase
VHPALERGGDPDQGSPVAQQGPLLADRLGSDPGLGQQLGAQQLLELASWDVGTATTAATLRSLARRIHELTSEAADHRQAILVLIRAWRPDLLARQGVGPIVAATVPCAWSHPGRCRSDAAFAMLGGAALIPASSGQTIRVRLNRSGDRQLYRLLETQPALDAA